LTRTTRSNASSGIGPFLPTILAAGATPAQFTRIRGWPSVCPTSPTASSAACASADVEREGQTGDGARHPLGPLPVEVEDRDLRSRPGQHPRGGLAQARPAAGDDRDLARDVHDASAPPPLRLLIAWGRG
jgi:hypothetical protein